MILSSGTPTHSRRSSLRSSQAIPIRPLYKRDIFYSGSVLQLPQNSSLQLAESQAALGCNMGVSVVSIPARDILEKVQQQLASKEADEKDAGQDESQDCCAKLNTFFKAKKGSGEGENPAEEPRCFPLKIPPSIKDVLKEMLDFSLLTQNSAFLLLAVANIFGMMGFYVPFVYITQYAVGNVYGSI